MVSYEDLLRLCWTPGGMGDYERLSLETSGRYVLEAVAAIEEHRQDRLAEEQPELHQELSRIDAKLQLVLELVAKLRAEHREREMLPRARVVLSADRIRFEVVDQEVSEGEKGVLRIYLHPSVPEPLAVPGRISAIEHGQDGSMVSLAPIRERWAFRDSLSRHVFRHHRRQVAASRVRE